MSSPEPGAHPAVAVTLLTQPACVLCEVAKAVLSRVGAEYSLAVTEVDLASPQGRELATRHGVLFAPGLILDGRPFSYGRLSEKKLRRHLDGL